MAMSEKMSSSSPEKGDFDEIDLSNDSIKFLKQCGMTVEPSRVVDGEKQWPVVFDFSKIDGDVEYIGPDGVSMFIKAGHFEEDTASVEYFYGKSGGNVNITITMEDGSVHRINFNRITSDVASMYQMPEVATEDPSAVFDRVDKAYQTFNDRDLSAIDEQLLMYGGCWISKLPDAKRGEALRQKAYCWRVKLDAEVIKMIMAEPAPSVGGHVFATSPFTILKRLASPKSGAEHSRFLTLFLKAKSTLRKSMRYLPKGSEGYQKALKMQDEFSGYEAMLDKVDM